MGSVNHGLCIIYVFRHFQFINYESEAAKKSPIRESTITVAKEQSLDHYVSKQKSFKIIKKKSKLKFPISIIYLHHAIHLLNIFFIGLLGGAEVAVSGVQHPLDLLVV